MNTPLTQEEKRILLQLLFLQKRCHEALMGEDFQGYPAKDDGTWPPTIPEDYDELLACGPFSYWILAQGGAYDFATELAAQSGVPIEDDYGLIWMAIGAACREDAVAAVHFIDLALSKLSGDATSEDVEPHLFGWTGGLLLRCQLGLACQLIGDAERTAKVRENAADFLKAVDQWILRKGNTPLPDCAHELRMMLDLQWYEEVRYVLRHLPSIYNFIGSYVVNLRLMDALIKHGMQEHILTMVGAGSDESARNNFRDAAMCAAFAQGNIPLAWDMLTKLEKEKDGLLGYLEGLAEHAAKFGQLEHWKNFLDWNDLLYMRPLGTIAQFHWMMSVSSHANSSICMEVWERARAWVPPAEGEYADVTVAEIIPYQLVIAAFAGDREAVETYLHSPELEMKGKHLQLLRQAGVEHEMEFAVEWAHERIQGEGNERILAMLDLELLRFQADKPNRFLDSMNYYREFIQNEPERYRDFGQKLSYFVRRKVKDPQILRQFRDFYKRRIIRWRDSIGSKTGNLAEFYSEVMSMDEFDPDELLSHGGITVCLINRFGIKDKIDRFDSGRGLW